MFQAGLGTTPSARSKKNVMRVRAFFVRTSRVPLKACPWCGELRDAATSFENASPRPGDVSICAGCGGLTKFDENLELVKVEEAEFQTWEPMDRLQVNTLRDAFLKKR